MTKQDHSSKIDHLAIINKDLLALLKGRDKDKEDLQNQWEQVGKFVLKIKHLQALFQEEMLNWSLQPLLLLQKKELLGIRKSLMRE